MRKLWATALVVLAVTLVSVAVWAVPAQITYQGQLEGSGTPVDGDVTMTFRLFHQEFDGTPLWEETQDLTVSQGIYSVILGTGTMNPSYGALEETLLSFDALWLEVQMSGEAGPMTPRQKITSVGFALRAGIADTVPDGSITTVKLGNDAVSTDKLAAASVTPAKVAGGYYQNLNADYVDGYSAKDFGSAGDVFQNQADIAANEDKIDLLESNLINLQNRIEVLENLLAGVVRAKNNIYFEGMNVFVRNGSGSTDGRVNGLGNLIVGYDKPRSTNSTKTGSHNLVVGDEHNYSSYGGFVAGRRNTISGRWATVSGGFVNKASQEYSVVSGGSGNMASGARSTVSGGADNTASDWYSSVSGGSGNTASGDYSSVSGGSGNTASVSGSSISGGRFNTASGAYGSISGGSYNTVNWYYSSISGGRNNTASGDYSSVSGGRHNVASGDYSFVGGGGNTDSGDGNEAYAHYSAILGGMKNVTGDEADHANGAASCIGGGFLNTASGGRSTVSGGYNNEASSTYSSVSGGSNNEASGYYSSVSGGIGNTASGDDSSVSGGFFNTASASRSTVSGGASNEAGSSYSSVSGGKENTAQGFWSSVSGGRSRSVSGDYDWRAGSLIENN